ncbi:MAG TPA: MlaD family protein [Capsulimonadaceae bacterium]|jgi:phospholipid/cholesterol/gamma-HCH transport system substrate-binding protein
MNTARSALQVGILVVLGTVLFVSGYIFFKRSEIGQNSYLITISFNNAQGVRVGSDIEYSGVVIGHVEDVRLSPVGTALVKTRINKDVKIPTDATVSISTSLLGSRSTIEIAPPHTAEHVVSATYYDPGATITGKDALSFDTLQTEAGTLMKKAGGLVDNLTITSKKTNALLDKITETAVAANNIVSDPALKQSLTGTVANIHLASSQGLQLTHDLREALATDNKMLQMSLGNVNDTTGELRKLTVSNHDKMNSIISNLNDTSAQVNKLVAHSNALLDSTSDAMNKGKVTDNLVATVANLKTATEKLNMIQDDLRTITGDKTVQGELKTTIHNVAQASGSTNELINRLNILAGGKNSRKSIAFNTDLIFWQNLRTPRFRTDFDLYAPVGSNDFLKAGIRDITGENRLNFQYGQRYNNRVSARAGVFNSKVGVGLDYDILGSNSFSADLYNPNRVSIDLRQRIGIGHGTAIYLGMEDIPRNPGVSLGLDLRH